MANPTASILVIGDEILSGRTREGNAHYLALALAERGISLREIRVVPDEHDVIVQAINVLRSQVDHLFTSGGIGPTHDDITADAVAAAFGVGIDVRADAYAILAARYVAMGVEFNTARQRMARIPEGAVLIENPVSGAPGFSLGNVHVMAGVPEVFKAMVASVLPHLTGGVPLSTATLRLAQPEGVIAQALGKLASDYPALMIGSYPFTLNGQSGTNLVFRGTDQGALADCLSKARALWPEAEG